MGSVPGQNPEALQKILVKRLIGESYEFAEEGVKNLVPVNFNASRNTDVPMRCDHEKLGTSLEHRLHAELLYPVTMLCPRAPVGGLWGCSWCNK